MGTETQVSAPFLCELQTRMCISDGMNQTDCIFLGNLDKMPEKTKLTLNFAEHMCAAAAAAAAAVVLTEY